jgi:hypothetical protein
VGLGVGEGERECVGVGEADGTADVGADGEVDGFVCRDGDGDDVTAVGRLRSGGWVGSGDRELRGLVVAGIPLAVVGAGEIEGVP